MRVEPSILHVDLDAFFAAVEQLDDPRLRNQPVVVGGLGNRGVVSTASYEARVYGVHSAMPMARARRACPHATFLWPRMARYSEKSREVMAILADVSPLVEQLSVDEAFVDVAGARRLLGAPAEVAALIRRRIRDESGLTASVGVATTKFLAKLSSELAKPDGLFQVDPGTERAFLAPLPLTRLWGVGPATRKKLERMGLRTIGEIAAIEPDVLSHALGASLGAHLYALANNDDPRAVVPEHDVKSIGAEETYAEDLTTRASCERELVRLTDRVASRVRDSHVAARTITLKIRFATFETRTRARTLADPTNISTVILETARELLADFDVRQGVRLLGISCSQLSPISNAVSLFDLEHVDRRAAVEEAIDGVRARFGVSAVRPATLVDRPRQQRT